MLRLRPNLGKFSISLRTNMHQCYTQADGIPQYIIMLEDAPKKGNRAGMPIANIELVMMALVAVLSAQHFPCKVDDWRAFPLLRAHGQHGKLLSTLPTSSANAKFWPRGGGGSLLVELTVPSLRPCQQSTAWKLCLITWPPLKDKILIWQNVLYQVLDMSTQYNLLYHMTKFIIFYRMIIFHSK